MILAELGDECRLLVEDNPVSIELAEVGCGVVEMDRRYKHKG